MKKILLTGVVLLVGIFPLWAQGVQANQLKEAIERMAEDITDYAYLASQTANVVDRTKLSFQTLNMIEKDGKSLYSLMKGEGIKNYFKIYGKEKTMENKIQMVSMRVTSLRNFASSIVNLSKDFIAKIVKEGIRTQQEKVAIIADVGVRASAAAATAGAAALIDFTPITNAVTLLKGQQAKENIKIFLVDLILMLNKLNDQLDHTHKYIMDVRGRLILFNDVGLILSGPKSYVYSEGLYRKRQKPQNKEDIAKLKKRKNDEDKLRKIKEMALKGRIVQVYSIKVN